MVKSNINIKEEIKQIISDIKSNILDIDNISYDSDKPILYSQIIYYKNNNRFSKKLINKTSYNYLDFFSKFKYNFKDKIYGYTYFQFKENRRILSNCNIPKYGLFFICLDYDFKDDYNKLLIFKNNVLKRLIEFLGNIKTTIGIQISKSGKGFHIYLILDSDVDKYGILDLFSKLKDLSYDYMYDSSVFDLSRFIFSSQYEVYIVKSYEHNIKVSDFMKIINNMVDCNNDKKIKNSKNKKLKHNSKMHNKSTINRYFELLSKGLKYNEMNNIDRRIYRYWNSRWNDIHYNITLEELLYDLDNLDGFTFRIKYGDKNTVFENIMKIFSNYVNLKGKELIKYITKEDGTRYCVVSISKEEDTMYDLFIYPNTDSVWFQSPKAVSRIGELGRFVFGVKLKREYVDNNGEVRYEYEKSNDKYAKNRPFLPPHYFPFLIKKIASNFGIDLPEDFSQKLASKYYSRYGMIMTKYFGEMFLKMIFDAVESKEHKVFIKDYIPIEKRRGTGNKIFKMYVDYINEEFGNLVSIDFINRKYVLSVKEELLNQYKNALNKNIKNVNALGKLIAFLCSLFFPLEQNPDDVYNFIITHLNAININIIPVIINIYGSLYNFINKMYSMFYVIKCDNNEFHDIQACSYILGKSLFQYVLNKVSNKKIYLYKEVA